MKFVFVIEFDFSFIYVHWNKLYYMSATVFALKLQIYNKNKHEKKSTLFIYKMTSTEYFSVNWIFNSNTLHRTVPRFLHKYSFFSLFFFCYSVSLARAHICKI